MKKIDSAVAVEPAATAPKGRKNNPEKTREDILQAAVAEFVAHGLTGARVDAIAERTKTSKRMIYYYFGSKEQLYVEVLEKLYGAIRNTESELNLSELEPVKAIHRVVEFTFDHHDSNVDFVRIVCIENIHYGENVKQSDSIQAKSQNIIRALDGILRRGEASGLFRDGVHPVDLHLMISSFCFYRISNRHTFSEIFQIELWSEEVKQRHKAMICDAVLRYLKR
ncbi:TetR/AcrR family transcriptional regulator [Pseudomonas savastanoi pv. phaseolicola]|nr:MULTISPECIES: TetR/AcrR family transcriptional regulator [Pseudomonas]KPB79297.1 Transcriptional regulator [Pseudomonas syringae pv. maculicola]AAZ34758.1 transcriptional regulator, TetR family [Pseudomonas savastanoi pv. phaseolicola 1448A]KPB40024.1 Transcriptional regulator [Pseudomonas savastanoi pv. phaseolicola]KPB43548.1 Transcriptional regulator [Pseudomonas savastanoi pv. phaseolicola]KPB46468.1 Transcriptional regulator [Pseudomonas savastanoi pv. phaseolicola]